MAMGSDVRGATIRRRTVVKGAAWATPAIVVGSAAPAMALSRPPGLQGWVTVGKSCDRGGVFQNDTLNLTIDGTGGNGANPPNDNTRGLWVFNTYSHTVLSEAKVVIYYQNSLNPLTWTRVGSDQGWTTPTVDTSVPAISGYTAYSTSYSGGWTFKGGHADQANDHHLAGGRPNFRASKSVSSCPGTLTLYSWRYVKIDGVPVSFRRGPLSL